MKKEGELIEKEKHNARRISIIEGSAASASGGFGDSFVIPFAQAIGSNAMHIGLISAFSGLISPISQLFGNKLMEKQITKTLVLFSQNPNHPSIRLHKLSNQNIWSISVNILKVSPLVFISSGITKITPNSLRWLTL